MLRRRVLPHALSAPSLTNPDGLVAYTGPWLQQGSGAGSGGRAPAWMAPLQRAGLDYASEAGDLAGQTALPDGFPRAAWPTDWLLAMEVVMREGARLFLQGFLATRSLTDGCRSAAMRHGLISGRGGVTGERAYGPSPGLDPYRLVWWLRSGVSSSPGYLASGELPGENPRMAPICKRLGRHCLITAADVCRLLGIRGELGPIQELVCGGLSPRVGRYGLSQTSTLRSPACFRRAPAALLSNCAVRPAALPDPERGPAVAGIAAPNDRLHSRGAARRCAWKRGPASMPSCGHISALWRACWLRCCTSLLRIGGRLPPCQTSRLQALALGRAGHSGCWLTSPITAARRPTICSAWPDLPFFSESLEGCPCRSGTRLEAALVKATRTAPGSVGGTRAFMNGVPGGRKAGYRRAA